MIFTGKNCGGDLFNKVADLQRDSNADVFLWNLENLYEHLFKRPPVVAASVAKTGKTNKNVDTPWMFLLKHNECGHIRKTVL